MSYWGCYPLVRAEEWEGELGGAEDEEGLKLSPPKSWWASKDEGW